MQQIADNHDDSLKENIDVKGNFSRLAKGHGMTTCLKYACLVKPRGKEVCGSGGGRFRDRR